MSAPSARSPRPGTTPSLPSGWGGPRGAVLAVGVASVVALMALSSIMGGVPLLGPSSSGASSLRISQPVPAPGTSAAPSAPLAPAGTGLISGSYFTNTPIALPAASSRPCDNGSSASSLCMASDLLNVTNDPSMVYSSNGVLAVAYTAMTTQAPCTASRPYATTEVGLTTSTNGGSTWSAPMYLGNSNCTASEAQTYTSAWQPSIAALGNGTLVLAYVEYNLTGINQYAQNLPPWWNPTAPPVSRLVLTQSYDNGAHWTLPTVLNYSINPTYTGVYFAPAMPSVAAYGNWIYVAWERLGASGSSPPQYGTVALIVSPNGGKTWSPTIPITSGYSWGMNPQLLVTPSQRLFLAYDYYPAGTPNYAYIRVATSTSNGTQFTTYSLPNFEYTVPLLGPYYGPAPRLAYSALYGELYVTFVGKYYDAHGVYATLPNFANSADNGSSWSYSSDIHSVFYNPSTSYSGPSPSDDRYGPGVYSTAVATDAAGNVYVSALVRNESICRIGQCGAYTELVSASSDNGSTFGPALMVNGEVTPGNGSWFGESQAILTHGSNLWVGYPEVSCPTFPASECLAYPQAPLEQSQVTVAQPFSGTGVTLTFHPVGLNNTTVWSLNFMGDTYTANGTNDLSFAGVPTGEPIYWQVAGINATPQLRFYPISQSRSSLSIVSGAFTDTITFDRFYPFEITFGGSAKSLSAQHCSTPIIYFYNYSTGQTFITYLPYTCVTAASPVCWLNYGNYTYDYRKAFGYWENNLESDVYCSNIQVAAPGSIGQVDWVEQGTTLTATLTNRNPWNFVGTGPSSSTACPETSWSQQFTYYYDYCYVTFGGYRFVSWTGTGNSSIASNQSTINVKVHGPAFETVNVLQTSSCNGGEYSYSNYNAWSSNYTTCTVQTSGLTFSENGLPTDVAWGVTLTNRTGSEVETATAPALLNVNGLPVGETYTLSAWDVPTATVGTDWVGTISPGSTAVTSFTGTLTVNYSLESLTGMAFRVDLNESGLPSGAQWSALVASSTAGVNQTATFMGAGSASMVLPYASDYTLGALNVYTNGSIAYFLKQVNVTVHTINSTAQIFRGNASFALTGDANITLVFGAEYWLAVEASTGGSASPASHWVQAGAYVSLSETPTNGYVFVGWTGSGAGSTTGAQRHQTSPTIRPLGPVTEVAVFALQPPPTYVASIQSVGLPAAQAYSVVIGGIAYSGVGSFAATNLSAGTYAITVPYVYDNATSGTRYYPTGLEVSWTEASGGFTVSGNGTITVTYAPQYLLSLSSTVGGTIAPAPGTYWEDLGTSVALMATPTSNRYAFVNWGGSGVGAVNSTTPTVTLVLNGPISESALFRLLPPPPPAVFHLMIAESGLPSNFGWNASVQGISVQSTGAHSGGTFGPSSTLMIDGLNGTYTLVIPTLSGGVGVRYVPNGNGNFPVTVTSNASYNVTFTEQYLLTVTVSGQGGTSVSTGWQDAGSTVVVTAQVTNVSWKFLIWNGTGASGTYTGIQANATVTMSGPITETATFGPVPPANPGPTSSTEGLPLALGLLAGLLVVGLLAGALMARRRRAPPAQPVEAWEASPAEGESAEPPTEGQP